MLFDCGENWEHKKARLQDWHDFFPLWPQTIRVDNGRDVCAWLQTIQRKGVLHNCYMDSWWTWEYREKPAQPRN